MIPRKKFLKAVGLGALAGVLLPHLGWAKPLVGSGPVAGLQDEDPHHFPIIDLHCHPSLKMYLWQEHLWGRHFPAPGGNEIQMQLDTRQLGHGFVKGMVAAHYLVEGDAIRKWKVLRQLFPWIKHLWHPLANRVEHQDASNFTQINIMIDTLENQVYLVNHRQDKLKFVIARSYTEFVEVLEKGPEYIALAHAIEGGHALGREKPLTTKRQKDFQQHPERQRKMTTVAEGDRAFPYIRNLEALYGRGVCLITLAHIFKNDLASPVEGVSDDEKKNLRMDWFYQPERDNCDLSEVGIAVAKRMLELGMIVDLTHSTPAIRQDVFAIAKQVNAVRARQNKQPRPLVFTHVGLQSVFMKYDHLPYLQNYKFYDVDAAEIDAICATDGVIGVIPENFWLVGADKKLHGKGFEPGDYKDGIRYIVETMVAINQLTRKKDFSNIGLGTDFDGFADAPRDMYVPGMLGALIDEIKMIKGITRDQVVAITSGNARRLLERGWGDPMEPVAIDPIPKVGVCAVEA